MPASFQPISTDRSSGIDSEVEAHRTRLSLVASRITSILARDPAVLAVFSGGSLYAKDFDLFSDLDLCCVTSPEQFASLAGRVPGLLAEYAPLEYLFPLISQNAVVAVFADGVRVDLMLCRSARENSWEVIRVLHDPNELLSQYVPRTASLPEQEVRHTFEGLALIVRDIDIMRRRGEFVYVSVCLGRLVASVTALYRHAVDPACGRYAAKKLKRYLSEDHSRRFARALALLTPESCVAGASQLVAIATDAIKEMGSDAPANLNWSFLASTVADLQRQAPKRNNV